MIRNSRSFLVALLTSAASASSSPALALTRQRRPTLPTLWEAVLLVLVPLLMLSWFSYRYWRLCQELPRPASSDAIPSLEVNALSPPDRQGGSQ